MSFKGVEAYNFPYIDDTPQIPALKNLLQR